MPTRGQPLTLVGSQRERHVDNTLSSWFESSPTTSHSLSSLTMTEFEHDEIQAMIDDSIAEAMRRHNRNATLISACLGLTVLAFYSHGLVKVVETLQK